MKRQSLLALTLGALFLVPAPLFAQGTYTDYEWARNLTREFGFDDMAEKIFKDMSTDAGRPAVEKQQGTLGLAELKQVLARRAKDLATQLQLYGEARALMQDAVKNWPDKNDRSYFEAIFSLSDLLQERGERAMDAINAGLVEGEKAESIRKDANADYGRAELELERIKSKMGRPDPNEERQKWRYRNAAWYRLCLLNYNKAMTYKKGGAQRNIGLSTTKEMLEEYILENETDDEEAMLGALYGYLLNGQVCQELEEPEDALGNYTSVLEQLVWEDPDNPSYRLHPAIQSLAERSYWLLLKFLNAEKRFDQTVRYGEQMESRWKRMSLDFKQLGRAARVETAEARLRLGNMNEALAISAEVVEEARGDASARLANQLVAEIIQATPDKSQFSPEIIRSAAKGAYSQGGEKRNDAIRYYQILLQVLDKVANVEERRYYEAEAWYDMGRAYYFLGRRLEAALVFGEGARRCKDVARDELNQSLLRYWRSSLQELASETKSPQIQNLLDECNNWIIQNPSASTVVAPGTLIYEKARNKEREALEKQRKKQISAAIADYEAAAKLYANAAEKGGPKKERAMIKGARTGLIVAELHEDAKRVSEARQLATKAKNQFKEYLDYSSDPANKLTDPAAITSRDAARAEARYSISRANRVFMPTAKELQTPEGKARQAALWQESLPFLKGFEDDYPAQTGLAVGAVGDRLKANLAVGNVAAAQADYEILVKLDKEDPRTAYGAWLIGKALKTAAEARFKAVLGGAKYNDAAAWDAAKKKPGFEAARQELKKVYEYYRQFLLAGKGQSRFTYWDLVTYQFASIGEWEISADLHRRGLKRFDGSPRADKKKLPLWKMRLLISNVRLAEKADLEGQADDAGRLWNEAGQMVDALEAISAFARNAEFVRIAAQTYGGYITTKNGLPVYFACQGRYDKALKLWQKIERSLKAQAKSGTEEWWEAKFYMYYTAFQSRKALGHDIRSLKKNLDSLKAANPDFGGRTWGRYFEWLERQLF